MRTLCLLLLPLSVISAGEPVPATMVTGGVLADLSKAIGRNIEAKVGLSKIDIGHSPAIPFWQALEHLATRHHARISIGNRGSLIAIEDGKTLPSSIDGPFRVVVTGVTAKLDLETNQSHYDVALLIHWEPRFPVVRIDTVPSVMKADDDRGTKLAAASSKTKTPIADAYAFNTSIRFSGLSRESKTIKELEGEFTVTAAPKMLAFTFDELSKLPAESVQNNVSVKLTQFKESNGRLSVQLKLLYPESHPAFESFESWADGNKIALISADRSKSYSPESFSLSGPGRSVIAEYHFKDLPAGDRKGWRLTYSTPAPLTEYAVKFRLKEIPLP